MARERPKENDPPQKNVWSVAVAGNYAYESGSNPIMTPVKVSLVCRSMRGKRWRAAVKLNKNIDFAFCRSAL